MNRDDLREVQRPRKQRYRADPEEAVITLRADGSSADAGVSCSVPTGREIVQAGLHPATGGDGTMACSGDLLLQALVACAGVTLRAVATNRGMDVSGTVHAEGGARLPRHARRRSRTRRSASEPSASASTCARSCRPKTSRRSSTPPSASAWYSRR